MAATSRKPAPVTGGGAAAGAGIEETAAAPLNPPADTVAPETVPAGPTTPDETEAPPTLGGDGEGYVDDDGKPIDFSRVFDMAGAGSMVPVQKRVYLRSRPPGIRTLCTTLMYAAGAEVPRAQAEALVALTKAGA